MQIADTQSHRYVRARDNGHTDYIEMARKCDSYYRGEQWDTNDIATLDDIPPPNKQDVGNRLAMLALKKNYGKK